MRRINFLLHYLTIASLSFLLVSCATPQAPMAQLKNFKPALKVNQVWRTDAGGGTAGNYLVLNPAYANGTIYTASFLGAITATNANTGHRIWQENTISPLTSGISANQQLLFTGTGFGVVYATNQSNGRLAWKKLMPSEVLAAPTVSGNTLLVKSENGELHALNIQNGEVLWTYKQATPSLLLRGGSSAAVSQGLVAIGFANGKLAVLTLDHGQLVWEKQVASPRGSSVMQRMVDIDITPVIADKTVYVATYQGKIAAYQLRSGKELWAHKLSTFTGLVVGPQNVYVTDMNSHVWAFNRQTGAVAWHYDQLYGRSLTAPALINQVLVVGDKEGYVHFLSTADGHLLARVNSSDKSGIIARPLIVGQAIYIYTNDGHLIQYRIA